jgi:hypothetical protein
LQTSQLLLLLRWLLLLYSSSSTSCDSLQGSLQAAQLSWHLSWLHPQQSFLQEIQRSQLILQLLLDLFRDLLGHLGTQQVPKALQRQKQLLLR